MTIASPDQDSTGSESSHGQVVRATSIIGGASVANIAFGLIRMKVAALVLGPAGVGLIGLLQNVLNAAATLGGLSIGIVGPRQIVAAQSDEDGSALHSTRRAIMIAVAFLSVTSGILFWLFRDAIAATFVHQSNASSAVGWLAIGVVLTIATGYQTALLTGLRRIGDLARISVLSAMVAAVVGSAAIILWREAGIVLFVLALPAATFAVGCLYVARIRSERGQPRRAATKEQISSLVRLGTAVTLSIFVALTGQLLIRTLIEHDLGPVALGHFQASWTITVTYLGFIFQAMGSDYLPRLTASVEDPEQTRRLVNDQTETALLLAAPALLLMLGLAPWVLSLLYTSEFREAAMMLRWQVLGDLLKLVSWPIGFVLLSRGAGRPYSFADITGTVILVGSTALLLPLIGIQAPGAAYFVMNLYYLALIFFLIRPHVPFQWRKRVVGDITVIASCCGGTFLVSMYTVTGGAVTGCVAAAGCALVAINRLGATLPRRLAPLAALTRFRAK